MAGFDHVPLNDTAVQPNGTVESDVAGTPLLEAVLTSDAQPSPATEQTTEPHTPPAKMMPKPATVEDCGDDGHGSSASASTVSMSATATVLAATPSESPTDHSIVAYDKDIIALEPTTQPSVDSAEPTLPLPEVTHHPSSSSRPSGPDPLSYLSEDSPRVTPEAIQLAAQGGQQGLQAPHQQQHHHQQQQHQQKQQQHQQQYGSHLSPSEQSHQSSVGSSYRTRIFSDQAEAGSQRSWTPDQRDASFWPGPEPGFKFDAPISHGQGSARPGPHQQPSFTPASQQPAFIQTYQPPAMTPNSQNSTLNTAQFPPTPAHPPYSNPQPFPQYAAPERPPLSGYQLLAAKLAGGLSGPPVKPIYRRFEVLSHRFLLHIQDEISELEEQLFGLDSSDTQARWHPQGIAPAARRRQWNSSLDELAKNRVYLLGDIGYKLDQYKRIMASFKETQDLPMPTMDEIQHYKSYLAAGRYITEQETRFLDHTDDLLSLAPDYEDGFDNPATDNQTPMPRPMDDAGFPPTGGSFGHGPDTFAHVIDAPHRPGEPFTTTAEHVEGKPPAPSPLGPLAMGMFCAMLVPILTFIVIPGFAGRMTVVLLVAIGVSVAVAQSGLLKAAASRIGVLDVLLVAGVYGGVMAVIAGSFH